MTRRAIFDWTSLYRQATFFADSPAKAVGDIEDEELDAEILQVEFLMTWLDEVHQLLVSRRFYNGGTPTADIPDPHHSVNPKKKRHLTRVK